MKTSLLLICLFPLVLLASESSVLVLLTDEEAAIKVAAQEESKRAQKQARYEELSSADIVSTRTEVHGGKQIIINSVRPLTIVPKVSSPDPEPATPEPQYAPEQIAELMQLHYQEEEQIRMSNVHVYGDEHSTVKWYDPETKLSYEVWTNIPLSFLQFGDSFDSGDIRYTYVGMLPTLLTRDEAERIAAFAAQFPNSEYVSPWRDAPYPFTEGQYEFYVTSEHGGDAPEKLYRQMTAFLSYYLTNEEKFRVTVLNARKLSEAREKYKAENPEPNIPTVINFWKIED